MGFGAGVNLSSVNCVHSQCEFDVSLAPSRHVLLDDLLHEQGFMAELAGEFGPVFLGGGFDICIQEVADGAVFGALRPADGALRQGFADLAVDFGAVLVEGLVEFLVAGKVDAAADVLFPGADE